MSMSNVQRASMIPILALVFAAISGCISEETPVPTHVAGVGIDGSVYDGWDYAGTTGAPLNGSIEFDVEDLGNNGTVTAQGTWKDSAATIRMTQFRHATDDFHSGGVAMHLFEHGDSGNGDTLLPKMFVLLATWGPASVVLGDKPLVDPYTGNETWSAHLMVTDTGIRDEADGGKVKSATGTFSPDAPADAVVGTDLEAILILQSTAPTGDLAATNGTDSGAIGVPGQNQARFPFNVPALGSNITVAVDFGDDPQEVGPYAVTLRDPNGATLVTRGLKGPNGQSSTRFDIVNEMTGNYTIEVASNLGVPGTFDVSYGVAPPPRPLYWFHWETIRIDAGAR